MLIQLLLILIFGMAAFCGQIGILVLEMKPWKALTGWLLLYHYEWQKNNILQQILKLKKKNLTSELNSLS